MKMRVICISGKAGHGKDTVAEMLQDELSEVYGQKVFITHYADLLKYILKTYFDWDGQKDGRGRKLLQYVGTDIVRERSSDFWVNFVASILKFFGDYWDWVIIPDTRFPNELDVLKEHGFNVTHIRVDGKNRDNLTAEQAAHPSETALDDVTPDVLIKNASTLSALRKIIDQWVKENVNE